MNDAKQRAQESVGEVWEREALDILAKAKPLPEAQPARKPEKLEIPPAPADALEVMYVEGWNACIDAIKETP